MLSLLRLACKQKNYSSLYGICIFLFLSYSSGIETINAFIHPIVPSKAIPIPDQNGPGVYRFLDHNSAKPLPDGAAFTYMAFIREYPPPPPAQVYSNVHFPTENYPCTGDLCCSDTSERD